MTKWWAGIYNAIVEWMYGGVRTAPPCDNYARIKIDDDFMKKLP